jgi:hypothetical protein
MINEFYDTCSRTTCKVCASITIFVNLGLFSAFWDSCKYKNMDKITHILENVVRCKYFEAGVHIKNPNKNSYQDGLGRTTQTLDHVVVVHILIWDKRKSQINEYSDKLYWRCFQLHIWLLDHTEKMEDHNKHVLNTCLTFYNIGGCFWKA